MAFLVEQTIKGTTYVYRTEGYWDKNKKQCRHRRICIGKKHPQTGEIIPSHSQSQPRACLDFGNYYLLHFIAQQTGLFEILQEVFPDLWQEIITCSFYELSERKPLYLCEQWCQSTNTLNKVFLSSQRISELLQTLGKADKERMLFFSRWAQLRAEQEYLSFDITSISSYSKLIETLEYGYNRDSENLPQVNLGMLFGQTSLLPVFYTVYPGSIRDVSTLTNMLAYAKNLQVKKVHFVMDKGLYSDNNLQNMLKNRVKFVISLPFTTNFAKTLADEVRKQIVIPTKSFVINNEVVYAELKKFSRFGKNLRAFIYYNERQVLDAKEAILKRIAMLEEILKNKKKKPLDVKNTIFKFLKLRNSKRGLLVRRNEDKINEALKYKGFNIIISNDLRDAQEVLNLYRSKDAIEKTFDNMKNELDMKRLRVHSDTAMTGRTFLGFISLIFYAWLDKKMKEKNLYKAYTQEEVMYEMKKLKIVELSSGKKIMTEITKKQKTLLKALEIPEPQKTLL